MSDLANDLTANGVLDTEKFTREGQKWIEAGLNKMGPVQNLTISVDIFFMKDNTEATCESRESVEAIRETAPIKRGLKIWSVLRGDAQLTTSAEDNEIIPVAGIDFVMSTNVPLVANLPASGKSSYATYISADEMMFSVALGGFEDVPDESNFKANIYQFAPNASIIEMGQGHSKPSLIDSDPETGTRRKELETWHSGLNLAA